ncbi:MAG: DNA primase [Anaerolineae bacterium]|nr:DNA primase [Anaerolineae bacterium]
MSVVDDIKARLDIVDVVSEYVNLQKAGRNFKALCPFHNERTPSFVVFPETQTWRCFGACGEGGDLFGFVMKAEGWDFSDALHALAQRAGVELQPYSPQEAEKQAESERLRDLLNAAALFFHEQLFQSPEAELARQYVIQRGLDGQTVEDFVLGYAPDDWRHSLQHLQMLNYTQDEIVDAGVAIRNDEGRVYDRFRHRLMIPIRDGRERTVGFGARALDKDVTPKYLNSPQGALFDKSRLLFGLDKARRAIRETETAIIVEGYMDVMQAHQAGYQNVVAQMGTALTEAQLRQLDKYATRLVLALDPDTAGINATMRGLNVARQTLDGDQVATFDPRGMMRYTGMLNMDIRVASLPQGQDPDDFIRENSEAWEALIADAVPVADYVIEQATAHLDSHTSYHEREAIARELLPILTATESDIQRSGNIQTLARRVRIDERTLLQWTQRRQTVQTRALPTLREQRRLAGRTTDTARTAPAGGQPGQSVLREGFFLRLLLEQPERLFAAHRMLRKLQGSDAALADALAPLNVDDFSRPDYQAVFGMLEQALYQDELDSLDYLYRHLPGELLTIIEELRVTPLEILHQRLTGALAVELESVLRDQARVNALPEPDTDLFVQEALMLRHSRLERESRELYFLQQDAQTLDSNLTDQSYQTTVRANVRARQLIAKALQQMKSIAREI